MAAISTTWLDPSSPNRDVASATYRLQWASQLLENPTLLKASALSLLTVFLATTFGPLQRLLDTTELSVEQWAISIVAASIIVVVAEVRKLLRRRSAPAAPAVASAAPAPASAS